MGAVDLAEHAREKKAKAAEEAIKPKPGEEAPKEQVEVAVVIFKRSNGQWVMGHDLAQAQKIQPQRIPTHDDIIGAFAIIQSQMVAQMTATLAAQATTQMQAQMAQAMASGQLPPDLLAQVEAERIRTGR